MALEFSKWLDSPEKEKIVELLRSLVSAGEIYVTGGAIRDVLQGRQIKDLDLTLVDLSPRKVAEQAARELSWALVPLHEEFGVFRVSQGGFCLDFSGLRPGAHNLEEDLRRRDFTFNALAVSLKEILDLPPERWPVIDPCGGLPDLQKGLIRAIARENLKEDPLRILRAYRFLALNYGKIVPETRKWLSEERAGLSRIARERIVYELEHIFKSERTGETLSLMAEDGVLFELFPVLAEGQGVAQPSFHHLDVWEHNLEALRKAEEVLRDPEIFFGTREPFEELRKNSERKMAVKLAALFHDVGKPRTFALRDRITFYEHEKVGAHLWIEAAERLRFRKGLIKLVARLIRNHMRPFHLLGEKEKGRLTNRAKRRLIRDVPEYTELFVVAMADALAAQGPDKEPGEEKRLAELFHEIRAFQEEILRETERERLITGYDLMALGFKPGPIFRELLEAVEEARVEGRIKTREEALEFLKSYLPADARSSGKKV